MVVERSQPEEGFLAKVALKLPWPVRVHVPPHGVLPAKRLSAQVANIGRLGRVLPRHMTLQLSLVCKSARALVALELSVCGVLGRVVHEQLVLLCPAQSGEALAAEGAHHLTATLAVHTLENKDTFVYLVTC